MSTPIAESSADCAARIYAEADRLEHARPGCAPIGGWYSQAVENVASRLNVNPYALDRHARGKS